MKNKIALLAAVDISYLTEDEQKMLWDIMVRQGLKIKPAYAEKLRKESGNLTEEKDGRDSGSTSDKAFRRQCRC